MANWKKIIVSGSNAHLNQITSSVLTDNNLVIAGPGGALENSGLTLSGGVLNAQGNSITSTGASTSLTGSFSGSFIGNGAGLTGLVTTLDVSGSNGTGISIDIKTQDLTITGTANEIETSAAGTTLTIGLPNDVTIGNNLTVTGDLTVNGTTTTINTTNLLVEDKFILLNSGSSNPDEGGLVIDEGSGTGHALIYEADAGIQRWGFNQSVSSTASTANTTAYAAAVLDLTNGNHADVAEYQKTGNVKVDNSGDIYIWA